MMDAASLTDALVAAGLLAALGIVISIGGGTHDSQQRTLGGLIALSGLSVAAVAVGAWHDSEWGPRTALVLLLAGGGPLLRRHPESAGSTELTSREELP